jgi:drug/metabolite transporter (DMT)-like permease
MLKIRGSAASVALGFVVVWSTGFIVARMGVPHAPPLGLLSLRFALTLAVLAPLIWVVRAPWPSRREMVHLTVAGLLVHAVYLSGVWVSIEQGMPSALSALIVNMQPIFTAIWVATMGERVGRRQWLGLGLGLIGVMLVVSSKWDSQGVTLGNIGLCVLALAGITSGTLYLKRTIPKFDLRTGSFVQYAASLAVVGPLALIVDERPFVWTGELVFALAWAVLALSIGAMFLLYRLIEKGSATAVTSLMYLVPPSTALIAWVLFDESYGWRAAAGMAFAAAGVALVQSGERAARALPSR